MRHSAVSTPLRLYLGEFVTKLEIILEHESGAPGWDSLIFLTRGEKSRGNVALTKIW
jgi:hypothetical protein